MSKQKKPRNKKYVDRSKHNNCWDELKDIYQSNMTLVGQVSTIKHLIVTPTVAQLLQTESDIRDAVDVLVKDLTAFLSRLESIHQRHQGFTGGTGDPVKHMEAMMIGTDYQSWQDDFVTVVVTNYNHVTAQIQSRGNQ